MLRDLDGERDWERERDRECERDRDCDLDLDGERERERERDFDLEPERDRDLDRDFLLDAREDALDDARDSPSFSASEPGNKFFICQKNIFYDIAIANMHTQGKLLIGKPLPSFFSASC